MPQAIPAAASAFANWAGMAAFQASAGLSIGTAATVANIAYVSAYAAATVGLSAAVSMGLGAIAQSRIPDAEGQKRPRSQPRPIRVYAIGGPARLAAAFTGAVR